MTLMPILAAATEAAANTAAAPENPFQSVAHQFGWEPRLFISQMILFVFVAAILAKFAYKPLMAMLEQRQHQIREGIENAEKTRRELANAQAKAQEILNQANTQGNKLIEEARASAAKTLEIETQKAIATANDIIAKAKLASDAELVRMKAELRKEVGRLVVATTAKVTGKILTNDDQTKLAEETNRQLAASN